MTNQDSHEYFCPLTRKVISDGLCADINYQRAGWVLSDVLATIITQQRVTLEIVNGICDSCIHNPLSLGPEGYTTCPSMDE